jgi:spore germination cell wall hydrolase CwlJ-like protein
MAACLALGLAACSAASADRGGERSRRIAAEAGGLSSEGLALIERGMGQGAIALASRFDPAPHADAWDRPAWWTAINLDRPPALPIGPLSLADAAVLNAALPADAASFAPAQPFWLKTAGAERQRAILCMTQAIYYEAALEPLEGQQAVAQTVINRMRHPDFPKSICGVVYQGSQLPIGCQFSFTCDGSLARPPIEPYWSRAKDVAVAALSGFVAHDVGSATYYHADYVFPAWGPQMVKIRQLGAHIFYRYPGPAGAPEALTGRYAGGELAVSMAGPSRAAIEAAKAAALAGGTQTIVLNAEGRRAILSIPVDGSAEAASISALRRPMPGEVVAGRRVPSRAEIAAINASLATPSPRDPATAGTLPSGGGTP